MRVLLACLFAPLAAIAADKPNIILIYSDDHGWADLGVQGVDRDIRTPNLDQLARDGVRFTRDGQFMSAVADNAKLAEIYGISANRAYIWTGLDCRQFPFRRMGVSC